MKKVSIIIPVYNCEEYLKDCFDSIVNQTMNKKDIEVIIINDGSKDSSGDIIKEYLKKNKDWIYIDRENKGIAESRNDGIRALSGKYLVFLDSDDKLELNALENMYNQVTKENCEVGIFRTRNFNSKTVYEDVYGSIFDKIPEVTTLNESLNLSRIIRSAAIIFKKELIKDIRYVPNVVHEDNYLCIIAFSKAKKIYVSKDVVYNIRKREGENLSITQKMNFKSYKDLVINIREADKIAKNNKLIRIHVNQLFGYITKNVPKENIYEAILLIKDYLLEMKNNKVINTLEYLNHKGYLELKYLIKLYKYILIKQMKITYLSFLTILSPKLNTKNFYKKRMGKDINLDNPQTFNEKIQWLKLNYLYPNELVTKCADKVLVRDYIKDIGCSEILNDIIKIYDDPSSINFDELPNKFVLKWNFGCGYNIICTDKNKLNKNVTIKMLKKWGKSKFHLHNSELHYKDIDRKIICEKFIEPEKGMLPEDYKFYCFNGKTEYVMICYGRENGKPEFYFLDRDWKIAKINKRSSSLDSSFKIEKPKMMDKMFEYADKLSKDFPFVRTDLYTTKDKVYFGELTFTPSAGLDTGYTEEGSTILANKINIKDVQNEKNRFYNKQKRK